MDEQTEKITGRMICRLRMAKGFAQKEVAATLQMTQQAYCKLEHRETIKTATLNLILNAMRSNMEEMAMVNLLYQNNDFSQ